MLFCYALFLGYNRANILVKIVFIFYFMVVTMSGIQLLLSDARGIYIPANFVECFDIESWGIDSKYVSRLSSPNDVFYWDNWDIVLNNAKHTDKDGNTWHLWQDGDLWAICLELMTEEEKANFGFED